MVTNRTSPLNDLAKPVSEFVGLETAVCGIPNVIEAVAGIPIFPTVSSESPAENILLGVSQTEHDKKRRVEQPNFLQQQIELQVIL